jgi:hypothetical protein
MCTTESKNWLDSRNVPRLSLCRSYKPKNPPAEHSDTRTKNGWLDGRAAAVTT